MFFLKQWCLWSFSRKLQPLPVLAASCCVRGVSDPGAQFQQHRPGWERGRAAPCHARALGFGRGVCKFGVVQMCLRLKVNQNKLTCLYSTWLIQLTLCECSPRVIHLFSSYLWIFPLGWKLPRFSCAWSFPPSPDHLLEAAHLMGDVFKKLFQVFRARWDVERVRWDVPVKVLHRTVFPQRSYFPSKASPLLM